MIDDVIQTAGVSRGTFYNYFDSNRTLLLATNEHLAREVIERVKRVVVEIDDPAERVACGCRLFLETAQRYPILGQFVSNAGLEAIGPEGLVYDYMPEHILLGLKTCRFAQIPFEVALDLVAGTGLVAAFRTSQGKTKPGYPDQIAATILRGLGVADAEIASILAKPLPVLHIEPDSLLARAQARADQQQPRPEAGE